MKTKIVATLGPASSDHKTMKAMVHGGVRIFRLNFSHADAASFASTVKMIREVENELGIPLTAMGDLCGPKIRIGEVEGSPLEIEKGWFVCLGLPEHRDEAGRYPFLPLDFPELLKGLGVGMPVSLSDGLLTFSITRVAKKDGCFFLRAHNGGLLTSNKGICFPGKEHAISAITPKDCKDLDEGLGIGLDAVAISFVQSENDIAEARSIIARHGTWIPVVAKLERKNAMDNLEAIVDSADAIMVARGDLGLECPLESLPVLQNKIIRACRHAQKGVIVATQMLLSMVKNPIPTRAEATDVGNAIMDGADCVMLSEETAIGAYPVEAVNIIRDIAAQCEPYYLERIEGPYAPKPEKNPPKYLAYAACLLADNTDAAAIVSHSTTGSTARYLSSRRPVQDIDALTSDPGVMRAMNFFWGVHPHLVDSAIKAHVERAEGFIQNSDLFASGDDVVITSGEATPGQTKIRTNEIKVYVK
ncbi:pyruvate kinase [Desulfoplanes sp.]